MSYSSHDILVSSETVELGPFASFRDRGQIHNSAKSAFRALHILEILAAARRPLRAVEISDSLALSPSSADQILKTMVDCAYLIFDPHTKLYAPSPRVSMFGSDITEGYFGPGIIEGLLQAAQQATGMPITLSTSQGYYMQLLDVLRLPAPTSSKPSVDAAIGLRIPMFGSCTGAAWLSTQSDAMIRATAKLCRRELGAKADDLAPIVAAVRRAGEQGHAYGGISADDMVRGLAVALPPTRNGIVLILGTFGTIEDMELRRDEVASILKQLVARFLSGG